MLDSIIAAVLCAALLHAGWNTLIKAHGGAVATILVAVGAGVLCALALPFVTAPAPASWPYIGASALAQVMYYFLLIATYRSGELSHAYPLMRGCAPLVVALVGALDGEVLGASQWLAVGLICGGVLAMVGGSHAGSRRTTLLAFGTAGVIALYTLIDGAGVRRSGAPAGYTMWIFVLTAVGVLALGWRRHGRGLLPFARHHPGVALGGGLMTAGSYGIALWAMTAAPVAAVAALRETAILFATLIAALVLRERVGPARVIGAVLIAAGAATMRLT